MPQSFSTAFEQFDSTCTKPMHTTWRVTGSSFFAPSFSTFSTCGITNSPSFCTISPRQRAASVRLFSLSLVNMEKHSCVSSPSSFFSVRGVLFTTDFHTWNADWRTAAVTSVVRKNSAAITSIHVCMPSSFCSSSSTPSLDRPVSFSS